MSDTLTITLKSSRFGDMEVAEASIIEIPQGLIGFPEAKRFVMLDHKPPFSWLHAIDDKDLAFVVIDGSFMLEMANIRVPFGDPAIGLEEGDDFAILTFVTVRGGIEGTTANIKAPVFVNIKNRKGMQVIIDNPDLSTRFPLSSLSKDKTGGETGK